MITVTLIDKESLEKAASVFCDKYCRFPLECRSQDELDEHCDRCEFIKILNLKEGENKMENCIVINGKKTELSEAQVESIRSSLGLGVKLADFKPEETCRIGEREFIVLGDMSGGTAVALNGYVAKIRFGDNNNFADENNDIRRELLEFQKEMEALVGADNFIKYTVDLTANDGMKDYGSVELEVSVMTADLRRKFAYTMDKFKTEEYEWLATAYSTPAHKDKEWVMCVSPSGDFDGNHGSCDNGGVRPFCILNSNIFVSK